MAARTLEQRESDNQAEKQALTVEDDNSSDSGHDSGTESVEARRSTGCRIACGFFIVVALAWTVAICIALSLADFENDPVLVNWRKWNDGNKTCWLAAKHLTNDDTPFWHWSALSGQIGDLRQTRLQASVLVTVALFCSIGATITSTIVAVTAPERLPYDFAQKGTLSNVSQDVTTPRGRLFTVALFTFGILTINSMYAYAAYRSWEPNIQLDPVTNPWNLAELQPRHERRTRTMWVIVPSVGLMITAAIPSLSDTHGFNLALTLVHNVFAPLSMLFCVVMETYQLGYGENAFDRFWTQEPSVIYGPLNIVQRLRVEVVIMAWIAGVIFLSIQVYLGVGTALGVQIKTCHALALVSFFAEVSGMVLAATLPCLAFVDKIDGDRSFYCSPTDIASYMISFGTLDSQELEQVVRLMFTNN